MGDIVSLSELKTALSVTVTTEDNRFNQAIAGAEAAIRSYTDRSFSLVLVTGSKSYQYDGSGILEIDDATAITSVALDGNTLASTAYNVQPYGKPPFHWLELPPFTFQSPEMGFTWNLDKFWWKYGAGQQYQIATVTGTFGWSAIPADVKQAGIWTAAAFAEKPQPFISESIEGYSRVNPIREAIPQRARDVLSQYSRIRN